MSKLPMTSRKEPVTTWSVLLAVSVAFCCLLAGYSSAQKLHHYRLLSGNFTNESSFTLFVKSDLPTWFEVEGHNFTLNYTANSQNYVEINFPIDALATTNASVGELFIRSLDNVELVVYSVLHNQNGMTDDFLVLPLPSNHLQTFSYIEGFCHVLTNLSNRVEGLNIPPRFTAHPIVQPSINEDEVDNNGTSVYDIAFLAIEDENMADSRGIAIVDADTDGGRWEYSLQGVCGSVWIPFPDNVSFHEALVLTASHDNRIHFVPNENFFGNSSLEVLAWDASDGLRDGATVNVANLTIAAELFSGLVSNSTSFSSTTRIFTVAVLPQNDAPVMNVSAALYMTPIVENADLYGPIVGENVILFASALKVDVDIFPSTNVGVAVVGVDSSNGVWQFSTDAGLSWTDVPQLLNQSSALLLTAQPEGMSRIRFFPNQDFNGESSFSFKLWDLTSNHSSGDAGVDTAAADPVTGAFSVDSTSAHITVEPANSAPTPKYYHTSLSSISEDLSGGNDHFGTYVADFTRYLYSDSDIANLPDIPPGYSCSAVSGNIAVVAADTTNGRWQYTGGGWQNFPNVSESSALLLATWSKVRFIPDKDYNGRTDSFTFKLWDLTDGRAQGSTGVNTTGSDPIVGAYSVDNVTAHLTIHPVNDYPILAGESYLDPIAEDVDSELNPGSNISALLSPVHSDVDGPGINVAIVGADERYGRWDYRCSNASQWLNFNGSIPKVSEALLLEGHCHVRFVPDPNFNTEFDEDGTAYSHQDLPFLLIRAWDGHGSTHNNLQSDVDTRVDQGAVFSKEIEYVRVVTTAVNDPPVISLARFVKGFATTYAEPVPPERTAVPVELLDPLWFSIEDVDNALLSSATFSFARFDGNAEFVSVNTNYSNLVFNSSLSTEGRFYGVLYSNQGPMPVEAFREVLITAQYQNSAEEPDPTLRNISISVADNGLAGVQTEQDTAYSTVNITLVNDPPVLDLDNDISDSTGSVVEYIEGDLPLLIVGVNSSLIDHDSETIQFASVSIKSPPNGDNEILDIDDEIANSSISVHKGPGYLRLFGSASPDAYLSILSTVTYENLLSRPGNPSTQTREVEFQVRDDDDGESEVSIAYVRFIAVNDPPEVDANGDTLDGLDSRATFVEGDAEGAIITLPALTVLDIDNINLKYIDVIIENPLDEEQELLSVSTASENIGGDTRNDLIVRYFFATWSRLGNGSAWRMSGLKSLFEYNAILHTLTYNNTAEEPFNTTRKVSIVAYDGKLRSIAATVFVEIENVNDSPYFNSSVDVITPSIYEDIPSSENRGYSLEEFAAGLILDNDRDAVKGIALFGADSQFGRWEYSTDFVSLTATVESNGTALDNSTINDTVSATEYSASWEPIPENTSISSSVVLLVSGEQTRVRFVPNKNFNGQAALTFVAWDASDDPRLMDGNITDASDQSDQDPFSSGHRVLVVRVNRTNDAPLLSPLVSFNLSSILEDDRDSAGDPVEELLRGVSEVDLVDKEHGIAVVGALQWLGEWQFSVDGGHSWTGVGNVSLRSAVLLRSSPPGENRIRFVPQMDFNGYSQVSFVAWDLSSGEPSGTSGVDVMSSDPVQGAFSRNMTTAMILVEPVNDSPHLSEGSVLLTISEDLPVGDNNGTSVMDLLNGTFSDVDEDPVLNYQPYTDIGVAVVGVDPRYGEWQYWCPGFTDWRVFVGDSTSIVGNYILPSVEKATLLLATCRVRFLPDLHFNSLKDLDGEYRPGVDVPFITIRAWDNTGLSAGQSGGYGRNTAYNQDSATNEFSSETYNATVNVTSVNDEPLLNISAVGDGETFRTEFVEDSQYVHITDPSSVRLVDFDNARLESLSVRIENSIDPDSELIDIVGDNSTVEVSGSAVVVRVSGREYHLQTMLNIYSNTSLSAESSLLVMSSPGQESASVEAYQLLIQHLVYRNLHPEPTNGTRQLSFKVDDGESVNTRVRTFVEVTLRAENIPVVMLARRMVFFTEGQPPTSLTSPQLLLTDRDHNEFFFMSEAVLTFLARPGSSLERLSVDLSTVPAEHSLEQRYFPESGSLVVSGEAPVSVYQDVLRSAAYGNTEEEPLPGQRIVSVLVTDNHNLSSKAVFVVIEVTSINDRAPEISAPVAAYTFVEGSGCVLLSGVSISDNDTGDSDLSVYSFNATISNPFDGTEEYLTTERFSNVFVTEEDNSVEVLGPASLEDFRKALSTLRYCNTAEEPVPSVRYIDLVVRDANFTSEEVTITVEFTLVNDQPVIDLNGPLVPDVDFITNYVEGSGAQLIVDAENLTVSDNDHSYLLSVTVVLGEVYDAPLELLSVDPGFVEAANISSAYNSSSGVLVLSGRASLQAYQSVLRTLSYQNQEAMPGLPTTLMREVTLVAFDSQAHSNISTSYITFISVNDAPFFDLNGNQFGRNYSTSFTEEGPAVLITAADMTLSDVDNTSLQSVTVSITNRLDGELEGLSLSSDSSLEGVLTLTGLGGLEGFREDVSRLRYQNLADEPQFEDRVIEFIANDGLLDSLPSFTTIEMISVNDAPKFQIELCADLSCENSSLNSTANMTSNGTGIYNATADYLSENDTLLDPPFCNSTAPNETCSFSNESDFTIPLNSSHSLNQTTSDRRRRSVLNWDLFAIQNLTGNTTIRYAPAPFVTAYVENSPSVAITNPDVVLVDDSDDIFVKFSLVTEGVLDPGFEFVFFHETYISSTVEAQLAPYVYSGCPDGNVTSTAFNLTSNFTLEEMAEAVKSLYYCNSDEFSTNGTRTVSMFVTDAKGGRSNVQKAFITVVSVNDEPFIATNVTPAVTIDEDGNYTLPALSFFLDHEEELTASAIQIVMVDPDVGTAEVDLETGDIVYSSAPDDYGVRTVWYQACDSQGSCSSPVSLVIVINTVNDPPVFGVTSLTVLEDTVVSLVLPGDLNATDSEDALNADSFSIVSPPGVGTLEYSGGLLVYFPPQHYHNVSDPVTFVLMVCDNDTTAPICLNQTISITYRSVNDAPYVLPNISVLFEDNTLEMDLTTIVYDVEEGIVASVFVQLLYPPPQHGTATYNSSTGILTYVPYENYFGGDVIVFQACDSVGNCSVNETLNISVLPVNDRPLAENATVNVLEDQMSLFSLCAHIYDADSVTTPAYAVGLHWIENSSAVLNSTVYDDLPIVHLVDPDSGKYLDRLVSPANASLRVFDAHGIIGYEPTSEFVGVDFLTFAVCDVCHTSRSGALGQVDLPPECLRQIEESGGGSLHSDNTNITCVERQVRVVVRNVDDVPHISDISAVVMAGGSVRVSPFEESRVPAANGSNLYLYTNSSRPVFEQDDLQMTIAASLGLDLTELLLHSDSDVDEESLHFSNASNGTVVVARDSLGLPHFVYTPDEFFQGYDSFEYQICSKLKSGSGLLLNQCSNSHHTESTEVQCSRATVRILVPTNGPNISSVIAVAGQTEDALGKLVDIDSKVSRGDRILINFASPTNMPPHGKASMTVTQQEIDAIFVFGRPFILPEIAPIGYEGRWNNATQFEVEILDEGYPQPEIVVGQWRVRVREGVSPCGGFNPVSRSPEPVDSSCLQDAAGTSFHSTATSEPISGNFGLALPKIDFVKVIPDTYSKRGEPSKDIFVNTLIALYLKEPLSHYQLQQYCSQDPRSILNPDLIVGPGAKLSISGCQNLMPSSENAEVVYRDSISCYEQLYPPLDNTVNNAKNDSTDLHSPVASCPLQTSPSEHRVQQRESDAHWTELPSYSEIIFRVTKLPSISPVAVYSNFTEIVKEHFNWTTLATVVSNATGVAASDYLDYTVPIAPPSLHVNFQHYDSSTPKIVRVVGISEDDIFSSGDYLEIVFDRATNTPPVANTSQVDAIFVFEPSIGEHYVGVWTDPRTIRITIVEGSGEEISRSRFTVRFTPTYLDEQTPLREQNYVEFSDRKPWCVGINVCGVNFPSLSVGVCDNFSISCRAYEPWVGLLRRGPDRPVDLVLIIVASILAVIIALLCLALLLCPLHKYCRKIHYRSKAKVFDETFWTHTNSAMTTSLAQQRSHDTSQQTSQSKLGNHLLSTANGNLDTTGTETDGAAVCTLDGSGDLEGSATESAEIGNGNWTGNLQEIESQLQTSDSGIGNVTDGMQNNGLFNQTELLSGNGNQDCRHGSETESIELILDRSDVADCHRDHLNDSRRDSFCCCHEDIVKASRSKQAACVTEVIKSKPRLNFQNHANLISAAGDDYTCVVGKQETSDVHPSETSWASLPKRQTADNPF